MRRKDREVVNIKDIIEIIKECDVCRIAFNDTEVPYILPLNFGYEVVEDNIILYFHSALEGRKVEFIKGGSLASFEMDRDHELMSDIERGYCTFMYKSVIGRGKVEVVKDEDKARVLKLLVDKYHPEGFEFNHKAIPRTLVYRLIVDEIRGKVKI